MKRILLVFTIVTTLLLAACDTGPDLDDMVVSYKLTSNEETITEISEEEYNAQFTPETEPYIQVKYIDSPPNKEDYPNLTDKEFTNIKKEHYREVNQLFLDNYDFGDLETSFTSYAPTVYISVRDLDYYEVLATISIFYDNEDIISITVHQTNHPVINWKTKKVNFLSGNMPFLYQEILFKRSYLYK